MTADELKMIQDRFNHRPRKRLGLKTPFEVFHQSLKRVALHTCNHLINVKAVPQVSVVITFRNGLPWILNAIDSLVAQSFTDWELLLIDDYSSDGSVEAVLARFGRPHNFRFLRSPAKGRGYALNCGLKEASGEWIANLDADDLFHPEKLKTQIEFVSHTNQPILLCTQSIVIGERESVFWPQINQKPPIRNISRQMVRRNHVNHSSIFVRRKFLLEFGGYDTSRKSQFDYELWLKFLFNNGQILEILERLSAKRIHKNQSFEARSHLRYVWASLLLQVRYGPKLGAGTIDYLFFFGKFCFGLMPRFFRQIFWHFR